MANQISKTFTHIHGIFSAMPLVKTVVLKDSDVFDSEKENIYPIVVIELLPSPAPDLYFKELAFGFEVLTQRDEIKTPLTSKLLSDSNYLDNANICDTIANNFVLEILKTHNDNNINVVEGSISEFEPIKKDERNGLDGVRFNCNFSLHQNNI